MCRVDWGVGRGKGARVGELHDFCGVRMSKRLNENLGRALSPCRISISRVTEGLSLESVHICVSPCSRVASVRVQLSREQSRVVSRLSQSREMCDGRVHFLFYALTAPSGIRYTHSAHTLTREKHLDLYNGAQHSPLSHTISSLLD